MEVAILIGLCVLAHGEDRFYSDSDKNVYNKIRKVESDQNRLEVTVLNRDGPCERPIQYGDYVSVHYNGTLMDGTTFDTTAIRGEPFSFQIGARSVILGWEQGLLGKCLNDEIHLVIPPHLGYGTTPNGVIPSNSVLVFDIRIVEVVSYMEAQMRQFQQKMDL